MTACSSSPDQDATRGPIWRNAAEPVGAESVASISLLGHPPIGKLRSSGKGLEVPAALVEGLHPTGGVVDDRDALIGAHVHTEEPDERARRCSKKWTERPTVGRFRVVRVGSAGNRP